MTDLLLDYGKNKNNKKRPGLANCELYGEIAKIVEPL